MRLGSCRCSAVVAVVAAAWSGAAGAQAGAQQPDAGQVHVRGVVSRLSGDVLELETAPGRTTKVRLPADAKFAAAEEAGPAALTQGAFVGTAAVAQPDGTLRALEVHVFPEAMRGTGEGHRPWDRGPDSSMTNASVSGVKSKSGGAPGPSSMTNATVSGVKGAAGAQTLTLRYPGGAQTVVVPQNTPIVKLTPGDRSLLVPGAHVFAIATAQGGGLVAQRLTVGKGATVPPM